MQTGKCCCLVLLLAVQRFGRTANRQRPMSTRASCNSKTRVVWARAKPNFAAQGGGGSGYQIRGEINTRKYEHGTLGMALSGKDTGGSQFFFCHAPQPHLDGGYTVFGQVIVGMEAVDKLTRGDVIERVLVSER